MAMAPLRHHCKTAGPCLGSRLKTGRSSLPTAVLAVGSGGNVRGLCQYCGEMPLRISGFVGRYRDDGLNDGSARHGTQPQPKALRVPAPSWWNGDYIRLQLTPAKRIGDAEHQEFGDGHRLDQQQRPVGTENAQRALHLARPIAR